MSDTGQDRTPRRRIGWVAAGVAAMVLLAGAAVATSHLPRSGKDRPAASRSLPPSPPASPSPTPQPGAGITGPLNVLLVGVDTRVGSPGWEPHSDAVLIMHITKTLDRAYLFSLPRDLVVDIPAFPRARFPGERTKLTHAMSYGSRVPGKANSPSTAQGFELLATTVSRYTGIARFDAGAVLTFNGLSNLVDTLGGLDLYIDQRVVSQHLRPDGVHRPGGTGGGYVGPQMVYEPGRRHLSGWQALDYARQRYTAGGDYTRQRHQQQLVRAIVQQLLSQELARDPDRLDQVLRRLNQAFTFEGHGRRVVDFAFTLSGLSAKAITLVALPGSSVGSGDSYRGEQLDPVGRQFIAAVRAGRVDPFLAANPKLVVKT